MNHKKICKLLKKILQNPKNVRFEDLDKLLKMFGYDVRQPNKGSSHYIYYKANEKRIITVPHKKPFIKSVYIKEIIKLLSLEDYYDENCR